VTNRLKLYSRQYCHLCHDMLAALDSLRDEFAFEVEVVDIDAVPVLTKKYNELVPVLEAGERELCRHIIDLAEVRAYLSASNQ